MNESDEGNRKPGSMFNGALNNGEEDPSKSTEQGPGVTQTSDDAFELDPSEADTMEEDSESVLDGEPREEVPETHEEESFEQASVDGLHAAIGDAADEPDDLPPSHEKKSESRVMYHLNNIVNHKAFMLPASVVLSVVASLTAIFVYTKLSSESPKKTKETTEVVAPAVAANSEMLTKISSQLEKVNLKVENVTTDFQDYKTQESFARETELSVAAEDSELMKKINSQLEEVTTDFQDYKTQEFSTRAIELKELASKVESLEKSVNEVKERKESGSIKFLSKHVESILETLREDQVDREGYRRAQKAEIKEQEADKTNYRKGMADIIAEFSNRFKEFEERKDISQEKFRNEIAQRQKEMEGIKKTVEESGANAIKTMNYAINVMIKKAQEEKAAGITPKEVADPVKSADPVKPLVPNKTDPQEEDITNKIGDDDKDIINAREEVRHLYKQAMWQITEDEVITLRELAYLTELYRSMSRLTDENHAICGGLARDSKTIKLFKERKDEYFGFAEKIIKYNSKVKYNEKSNNIELLIHIDRLKSCEGKEKKWMSLKIDLSDWAKADEKAYKTVLGNYGSAKPTFRTGKEAADFVYGLMNVAKVMNGDEEITREDVLESKITKVAIMMTSPKGARLITNDLHYKHFEKAERGD